MAPQSSTQPGPARRLKWRRRAGLPLLITLVLIGSGCEFSLFEPPELPKWSIALTMPLINKSYTMAEVVNDSTIFADSVNLELQVQFAGALDTSRIDANFLEVELPDGAVPDPINETVAAPDASSFFSAVAESVVVSFALDDLLTATGVTELAVTFPDVNPFPIPQTLWNNVMTVPPVSPLTVVEGPIAVLDTATLLADFPIIQTIQYIELSSTGGANKFVTRVFNDDWPTDIEAIALVLQSGALTVTHDAAVLTPGSTFDDSTDLASAQLGTDLTMSVSMSFPTVGGDIIIAAGTDPKIEITVRLAVSGVDSVAIRTNRTSLLPAPPAPIALPSEVELISGVLRSGETDPINFIKLTGLRSTLPFDIEFALAFPNFSSSPAGTDSLRFGPTILTNVLPTINDPRDLSGFSFLNPAGNTAIDSFEFELLADVLEQDVVLPLDGSTLGEFQVTFEIGDLYFSSITGNFEIAFDAVNTTIEDIPTGFAGFEFDRLSLTLIFHNQTDLPVALDLVLQGRSLEGDSATVPINAPLNYPSNPTPPGVTNGSTANTVIVLDQNSVRTYWLPDGSTDLAQAWDSTVVDNGEESIVDVLNLPPETIIVGGAAEILGEGTVAAGSALWGEFELVAPFAFIMSNDITFLPANPIELPAMDPDTRETVRTALLGASLTVSTLMDIPIGGSIAMLVSDTTLFSLALDKLDDIAAGIPTAARTGDTTVYNNLSDVLAADSITGISHIVFFPDETVAGGITDPRETRAKRVDFYTNPNDTEPAFFNGRLFQLTLPGPRSVNSAGHVTEPGDTTETLSLDAERVSWIASDSTLYMNPLITFNGSNSVRTFRSSDSIRIAAFITFNVSSEFLSPPEEVDPSEITITPAGNFAVETGDTVWVDLDSVFTHPTVAAADMEVAVSSSHTGIVSVALRNVSSPTPQKLVRAIATGPGTAKITVTADDDGDDDIPAVETSFLVTVSGPSAAPRPPAPNLAGKPKRGGP